jgi:membrane-associated protein
MMPYGRYFGFDVIGGVLWVATTVLGGYMLGSFIPNIDQRIHYVIAGVIFLSLLPPIISYLRARKAGSAEHPARVPSATSEPE